MAELMMIPRDLEKTALRWLKEDIPGFDFAAACVGSDPAVFRMLGKSTLVVAGAPFVDAVFRVLGCTVSWLVDEGTLITGTATEHVPLAMVRGPAASLLQGERTALEVFMRCSAIATTARRLSSVVSAAGWPGRVAGTRKTTPGFRLVEKYGLIVGGADPHRMTLSSCVMLKDNHIDVCGGDVASAVAAARRVAGFTTKVEVECRSNAEAHAAAAAGADVIMLDNFPPAVARQTSDEVKSAHPKVLIEYSGGVRPEELPALVATLGAAVDIVSLGALTHAPDRVDVSLKFQPAPRKAVE